MWNSTAPTRGTCYIALDPRNFYLATPLDDPEYMRIAANLVPQDFTEENNIKDKIKDGYIYMHIIRGIYSLPQTLRLANKLLKNASKILDTAR